MSALQLADARRSTPGRCAVCPRWACWWERTGITRSGLVLAWRACENHKDEARTRVCQLTTEEVAARVPRHRREARATACERRAARLMGYRGSASASLAGASSLAHAPAQALLALAAALRKAARG